MKSGNTVNEGDTLGTIFSNAVELEIMSIENSLNELSYILNISQTGEKPENLEVYEKEYKYALVEFNEHSNLLSRYELLAEKGLTSEINYEIEEAKNKLFEINVEISKSKIKAAKTGTKESEIDLIKEQIESARKKLELVRASISNLTIISPLKGIVERSMSRDTLLTISSTTNYVLLIPIKLSKSNLVAVDQKVNFYHPSSDSLIEATIIDISNKAEKINETDVILVFANSINNVEGLQRDMIVETKIYCGRVTLLNFILLSLS